MGSLSRKISRYLDFIHQKAINKNVLDRTINQKRLDSQAFFV